MMLLMLLLMMMMMLLLLQQLLLIFVSDAAPIWAVGLPGCIVDGAVAQPRQLGHKLVNHGDVHHLVGRQVPPPPHLFD